MFQFSQPFTELLYIRCDSVESFWHSLLRICPTKMKQGLASCEYCNSVGLGQGG